MSTKKLGNVTGFSFALTLQVTPVYWCFGIYKSKRMSNIILVALFKSISWNGTELEQELAQEPLQVFLLDSIYYKLKANSSETMKYLQLFLILIPAYSSSTQVLVLLEMRPHPFRT
jgi:hypothetical protein